MAMTHRTNDRCPPARRLRGALSLVGAQLLLASAALADCGGMVLHAHRGSAAAPENSLPAVQQALDGGWDGAEIDIQQLRDGQWVLQHDPVLGRTTTLQKRMVRELDATTWHEIRLKDQKGRVTNEAPPFLADLLQRVPEREGKVLNVEIKQLFGGCDAARDAVVVLAQGRPAGAWFLTSTDRRHLQCARRADPQGYLGLIVLDPQALTRQNRLARASRVLPAPRLDLAWLRQLQQEVSRPVGVHVDVETLQANPRLLADAKELGLPVFSYHLGPDARHAQLLRAAARTTGLFPSGAIIEGTASAFCASLPELRAGRESAR